jgi:hypothetical protein
MVVPLEALWHHCEELGSPSRTSLTGESVSAASANSLGEGLFGCVHHLADENPAEIAALRARYQAENRPRDAIEEFLVRQLFIGDVQSQRVDRAVTSEIRRQQRHIRDRWEEERTATAGTLREQLMATDTVDLVPIVTELRGFSHGLEAIEQGWLGLRQAIQKRGFLSPAEWVTGVRLMAVLPTVESLIQHPGAFLFTLWSARCNPLPPVGMIETLLQPANRPAGLEHLGHEELLPDPAACREQLIKWIDDILAKLITRAAEVARTVDGPELKRLLNPAAIVIEPEKAKRYDRARSQYQSTVYRALNALETRRKGAAPVPGKPPRPGAERADSRDGADRDEDAAARAARDSDIKPPTADVAIVAGASGVPVAVTEVACQTPDGASDERPKGVLQNGAETGPDRAAADRPGACRSYHRQVAKRPVGTAVTVRSRPANPGEFRSRKQ